MSKTSYPDQTKPASITEIQPKPLSRWLGAGCILFVIAAALHSADKPIGGGDTWVAMACGRYTLGPWAENHPDRTWQMRMLDHFGIHITKQDPFSPYSRSFIPGDHENFGWINQNWLTHILFFKMRDAWGESSIVLYKFIQAILTALVAYWAARVLGAHQLLAAAAAAFGTLLSRSFIDLRPNVSSILFAIIMILLYAYWKKNRPWALAWMIPLTIIWANVHGGFIYANMVFFIFIVAHLVQFLFRSVWPDSFVPVSGKAFLLLLLTGAAVTLIPAFFSPFGWENLAHPWIIAFSDEGKLWRNVIEWRPIWDKVGFGNRNPYLIFLSLFAVMFVVWWISFFVKPKVPPLKKPRKLKPISRLPWPKIDLAQIGIIAVTILMSIKSRRFIFLGGVVLSPFLAQMAQQIIDMSRLRSRHKHKLPLELPLTISNRRAGPAAALALAAAAFMFAFFAVACRDLYFKPSQDGEEYSLFRKMVGILDQPVRAINFFDDNHVKGLVFNEWTNGGFVPFWQEPDPDTGYPPCQVYIDGRAQAAYKVSHFQKATQARLALPRPNPAAQNAVFQIAAQLNIQKNDPQLYPRLVNQAQRNPALLNQLRMLANGDLKLLFAIQKKEIQNMSKRYGLKSTDPQLYEKLILAVDADPRRQIISLFPLAVNDPDLFDQLLKHEEITVALLSLNRSPHIVALLEKSNNWKRLYIDDRNTIFFRVDAPENKHLINKPLDELIFPDDFSRKLTLGYALCRFATSPDQLRQGLDHLISIDRYDPKAFNLIYTTGFRLHEYVKIYDYFAAQLDYYKDRVDNHLQLGRLRDITAVMNTGKLLAQLAKKMKKTQEEKKFRSLLEQYQPIFDNLISQRKGARFW